MRVEGGCERVGPMCIFAGQESSSTSEGGEKGNHQVLEKGVGQKNRPQGVSDCKIRGKQKGKICGMKSL